MKRGQEKDYYKELVKKIDDYEAHPWLDDEWHHRLSAISDKIVWCHDWKKITQEQSDKLCSRVTAIWDSFRRN